MPGLQAHLVVAPPEPDREVVVVDHVAGAREQLVMLAAAVAHGARPLRRDRHPVRDHPAVLERSSTPDQLVEDGPRAVGALAAAEAGVDHDVLDRVGAVRPVGDPAQPPLVVRAALVLVEIGAHDDDRRVVARRPQRERLVVDLRVDRQLRVKVVAEHRGDGVDVGDRPDRARLDVPHPLAQRQLTRQRRHPRRRDARAEAPRPVARLDREHGLHQQLPVDEDQLAGPRLGVEVALDLEVALGRPAGVRERRARAAILEHSVALTGAPQRDLAFALLPDPGPQVGRELHAVAAVAVRDQQPPGRFELMFVGKVRDGDPRLVVVAGHRDRVLERGRAVDAQQLELERRIARHPQRAAHDDLVAVTPVLAQRGPVAGDAHADRAGIGGDGADQRPAVERHRRCARAMRDVHREAHAPAPDETGADADVQVEAAVAPAAQHAQPARGDRRVEPRPRHVVQALARVGRRVGPMGRPHLEADRVQRQAQAPQRPDPDHQHGDALRALAIRRDPPDEPVAAEVQPLPLPVQVVDLRDQRELGVEAVDPLRDLERAVGAVGVVAVPAPADAHVRGVEHVLALEAQDLEQLGHQAAAHEVVLEPVDRGDLLEHVAPADAVEERVHAVDEDLAVLVVGHLEDVEVVAEVLRDHAVLVPAQPAALAVLGQEVARQLHGLEAIQQRALLRAPLGDRQVPALTDAVVVDRRRDHVNAAGEELRRDHDGDVLVQHPLREAEAVLVPERAPPQLVGHDPVREQLAELRDVGLGPVAVEHGAQERRMARAGRCEPVDVAGREVRAGRLERAQQRRVGGRRQHVVGVQEREVLAGHVLDAGVARRAEAAVGPLHDADALVVVGVAPRDLEARVGRAVVDDQDLEVAVRLAYQRRQALVEVVLDVVDGNDDADLRHQRAVRRRSRRTTFTRSVGGAAFLRGRTAVTDG